MTVRMNGVLSILILLGTLNPCLAEVDWNAVKTAMDLIAWLCSVIELCELKCCFFLRDQLNRVSMSFAANLEQLSKKLTA